MAVDVEQLRNATSAYPDARLVVLFGSVARGAQAPWSDVDLGILGLDFWRGLDLGSRLGALVGREPHVVDLASASTWLRYLVARDGILLRESRPGEWAQFQAEAALRWFELQPIVALCAEGARRNMRRDPPVG